jgi:hypothetical protein
MEPNESKIWFPAKKYGWGWGPPNCWQGWAILAVWTALLCGGAVLLKPHTGQFVLCTAILSIALFIVCLYKGEKPRWRWGKG